MTAAVIQFIERAEAHLPRHIAQWRDVIAGASLATGTCPWLIAAIMDRESLGGAALKPRGPAGTGDSGHGRGLMQIDDRSHLDFIRADFDAAEGAPLWTMPAFNVLYGAELLAKNTRAFLGDTRAAIAAYNAGRGRVSKVLRALPAGSPAETVQAALDRVTTGGQYVTNVLAKRRDFMNASAP